MRLIEELGDKWTAPWSNIVEYDGKTNEAKIVLTGLHNNNGLGRGPDELLVIDAGGGVIYSMTDRVQGSVQMDSALDNPFVFKGNYLLAGYPRAWTFMSEFPDPSRPIPSLVWYGKRKIFQDDGKQLRSASSAAIVETGKMWLFVTGGAAKSMVAMEVDL